MSCRYGRDGLRAALLTIDPATAAHLVCALSGYTKALRSIGRSVPPDLDALLDGSLRVVRTGQLLASSPRGDHDGGVFLTMPEAAALLRLSTRTLRRRAADGDLAVVRVGRRVLVERSDLLAFVEAR